MVRRTLFLATFFSGTAQDRLTAGVSLFRQHRLLLQADPEFCRLLRELAASHAKLATSMQELGLGRLCSECGTGCGGCCSAEMAEETDAVQICLNLMAGVGIRMRQDDDNACRFLGTEGCIFRFKPMFCLNYHCSAIRRTLGPSRFTALEQGVGKALGAHYLAERRLLELLPV